MKKKQFVRLKKEVKQKTSLMKTRQAYKKTPVTKETTITKYHEELND